jgi:hypothetical protein
MANLSGNRERYSFFLPFKIANSIWLASKGIMIGDDEK